VVCGGACLQTIVIFAFHVLNIHFHKVGTLYFEATQVLLELIFFEKFGVT
jgi:hypothetical protein